ncbi:methyl-accepting chemotaxis protein [Oceaniserpentilla sp. 4NH20-0058]|uniref:methyl-accepting chemotaxis protein n=1 Tax=Oceaniserpentilla sp. 4NH20-0058 TaxID=3127660 RepID=UPI0031082FA4
MNLREKIVALTVASISVVAITLIGAGLLIQMTASERFETATIDAKAQLWEKISEIHLDAMEADTASLMRDREIKSSLKKGNYQKLTESAATSFKRLSTSGVLTRLIITNKNSEVVFSEPSVINKNQSNPLVAMAIKDGSIVKGLSHSYDNTPVLQVVFPISTRGKVIGTGIFEKSLDAAISEFNQTDKSHVSILNTKGDQVISTDNAFFSSMSTDMPENKSNQYEKISLEDKVYAASTISLKSKTGQLEGYLLVVKDFTDSYTEQDNIFIIASIFSFLVVTSIVFSYSLYIKKAFNPLSEAITSLKSIANGDLTTEIVQSKNNDEVGNLLSNMSLMTEGLRNVISKVGNMAQTIELSTRAMENISNTTNQRATKQLDESSQVTKSIESMNAIVQNVESISENNASSTSSANKEAAHTNSIVNQTKDSIEGVASKITRASAIVSKLGESIDKIGSVIEEISGISEQTNLLALNAAIEAARAGEQGRGFAVVADEVRNLAQRTQKSTADINNMIGALQEGARDSVQCMQESIEDVTQSVDRSQIASDGISSTSDSINNIERMNIEIVTAIEEQITVFNNIRESVNQISELSENTALSSEQTSIYSGELRLQAEEMKKIVNHFKI